MLSLSSAVVGLVRVMELRALRTRCVGSLMKCLAEECQTYITCHYTIKRTYKPYLNKMESNYEEVERDGCHVKEESSRDELQIVLLLPSRHETLPSLLLPPRSPPNMLGTWRFVCGVWSIELRGFSTVHAAAWNAVSGFPIGARFAGWTSAVILRRWGDCCLTINMPLFARLSKISLLAIWLQSSPT